MFKMQNQKDKKVALEKKRERNGTKIIEHHNVLKQILAKP